MPVKIIAKLFCEALGFAYFCTLMMKMREESKNPKRTWEIGNRGSNVFGLVNVNKGKS